MRRIGNLLLWAGVAVGIGTAAWYWAGPRAGGLPWLVGIGLIKLTFVASLSLIGSGAVALRLANRKDPARLDSGQRRALGIPQTPRVKDQLRDD